MILNDLSGSFEIIIKVCYTKKINANIEIQKQKQIVINTTVNKARLISRSINDEYKKNPKMNTYAFDLENLLQNENYKYQIKTREKMVDK